MSSFKKIFADSDKALCDDPTKLAVGDEVVIRNNEFYGIEATVTGFERNMFGAPLVVVIYRDGDYEGETVFYPYELEKRSI